MKKTKIKNEKQLFGLLDSYIDYCRNAENRRVVSSAGFCRFCMITRSEYSALAKTMPRGFDILQSVFIDEALNGKISNNAAVISWLTSYNSGDTGNGGEFNINVSFEGENDDDWQ
ncbi:MAG: hypothetical protein J5850_03840 [Clostridia bacterium]|nr:hypothetical protein [Clostridia bacterium]